MPDKLEAAGVDVLRRLIEREVKAFEALCTDAQIKHEEVVAASYALCTAVDEAAHNTEWGGAEDGAAGAWAAQPLSMQFHGDTQGGNKFFVLASRLAVHPQEHIDLLELLHQILGLGFEGRFAHEANGRRRLETIRQRLFKLVAATRGDVPETLSPHWRGAAAGTFRVMTDIPVWMTVAVLSLGLLGQFTWYKYQLVQLTAEVVEHIAEIGRMQPPEVLGNADQPPSVASVAPSDAATSRSTAVATER
jgi:type VI secretion system protein ImpK